MSAPRIVIYVEDPGAANMVLGLDAALKAEGAMPMILAGGHAVAYLRGRDEPVADVRNGVDVEAILDRHSPAVLAIGTSEDPETPAFDLARAARGRGIPTACLIDGPANPQYRLRGLGSDPLEHLTDWLFVADLATRDAYAALGADASRILPVGNPNLDRVRTAADSLAVKGRKEVRRECFPDLPEDSPLILFLTELSDGLGSEQFRRNADYAFTGRGKNDGRTEVILEEVIDAIAGLKTTPRPLLALRLHPKTPRASYDGYADEIAAFNEGGSPYPALYAADLVVGITTVLLFEAAVVGCNVLSIPPRTIETSWLSSNDLGLTPVAGNREELQDALVRALERPGDFMPARPEDAVLFDAAPRIARALANLAREGTPYPPPPVLETERLRLEPFPDDLLTERYVGWLNDPEVVRFSEQRHRTHTLESCREFIESFRGTPNALWAIREKARDLRHIGNVSTEIDPATTTGDIRILIGEKECWGTGLGLEAWRAVMAYLFDDLGLARVTAGTLEANRGMLKIMQKSGMQETHRAPGPTPVDGRPMDLVFAERRAADWRKGK